MTVAYPQAGVNLTLGQDRLELVAVALNFWSTPGSLRSYRRVAWLDCEGRALFRVGTRGQPVSLTGTAWFGCGPGPR
jgi:hypothetical protein